MMLLAALACVALPLVVIPAVPHPKARRLARLRAAQEVWAELIFAIESSAFRLRGRRANARRSSGDGPGVINCGDGAGMSPDPGQECEARNRGVMPWSQ